MRSRDNERVCGSLTVLFLTSTLCLAVLGLLQVWNSTLIFIELVVSAVAVLCSFCCYLFLKIRHRKHDDLTPPPPPHSTNWF